MLSHCGSLAQPEIQAALTDAQQTPDNWMVYLVRQNSHKRSEAQNRLYRRLLSKFAQQIGPSVQYWHEFLVDKYLGCIEVPTEDGYMRSVLVSTADLSVSEFTSFLDACLRFASESQVDL